MRPWRRSRSLLHQPTTRQYRPAMFGGHDKVLREGTRGKGVVLTVEARKAAPVPPSFNVTVRAHFDDGSTVDIKAVFHTLQDGLKKQLLVLEPHVGDVVPTRFDPENHNSVVVDMPALAAKRDEFRAHGLQAHAKEQADAIKRAEEQLRREKQ